MIEITNLRKQYASGFVALDDINLKVNKGEILALLGPNGAGKTTLISIICGIVNPSSGAVTVGGFDIIKNYRQTRSLIGLVPQELTTDAFETPWNNLTFSRGLFGLPKNPQMVEKVLKDLSLWDKKDDRIMTLSGGMKRRLLIGKALVHEPQVLFLDEPTAGVDVSLRQDMWRMVDELRNQGVTIVLTTHYIEEAEAIADRIGVISGGKLLLVEDKKLLMSRMGQKQLKVELIEVIVDVSISNPTLQAKKKIELEKNNIGSAIYYPISLEKQDAYKNIYSEHGVFENSNYLSNTCLSLPIHPFLSEKDALKVCNVIRNIS